MTFGRLLPVDALRPRWSSGSALVYIGAFVVLVGTGVLLGIVADDHGEEALVGASLVASAAALGLAFLLEGRAHNVAAGVFAFVAVTFFVVFVGSVESWLGILDAETDDYQPGSLLVEGAAIGASLAALQRFRAPLLILPVALTVWITVADLASAVSVANAGELLSMVVGVGLAAAGVIVDRGGLRPYGFWVHAVAGIAFGGAVLTLVEGDGGWALVGLLSLLYVAIAYWLERASYAVLGAVGILATTTYVTLDSFSFAGEFLPFGVGGGEGIEPWQATSYFVVAGLLLAVLGLLDERITPRLRPTREPVDA